MSSRNTTILALLLLILAFLVAYRFATYEEPVRVKELTYKPGGKRVREDFKPAVKEVGKTMSSNKEKRRFGGVIRNPFQALYPPTQPPVEQKIEMVGPPPPQPTPFPVITARGPSPAQIESGRFKFLGFLQKEGERKIFLSRDKEIFIAKKGDNVSIFQVADITENSVTLISRDSKEEFKLIIEDLKPTKPVPMPGGARR